MNPWYPTLNRPPLTPPDWVFAPVWTVLYVTIAIATLAYYRSPARTHVAWTSAVLAVHLLTNFAWTPLFFSLRSPALALVDIVALDLTLVALVCLFWRTSTVAGALLLPYLAWVLFATYLNAGFYRLN